MLPLLPLLLFVIIKPKFFFSKRISAAAPAAPAAVVAAASPPLITLEGCAEKVDWNDLELGRASWLKCDHLANST